MTPDEYRQLVAEYGSAAAAAVAVPDRHEEILDAFVRHERTVSRPLMAEGHIYVPRGREWFEAEVDRLRRDKRAVDREEQEARIRGLRERELRLRLDAGEQRRGGRPIGSFVGEEVFWVVWKMVLDDDASANKIATVTNRDPRLEFVNREKAAKIVKAVRANRAAARRAAVARKPPRGFSATQYGIRLPEA